MLVILKPYFRPDYSRASLTILYRVNLWLKPVSATGAIGSQHLSLTWNGLLLREVMIDMLPVVIIIYLPARRCAGLPHNRSAGYLFFLHASLQIGAGIYAELVSQAARATVHRIIIINMDHPHVVSRRPAIARGQWERDTSRTRYIETMMV